MAQCTTIVKYRYSHAADKMSADRSRMTLAMRGGQSVGGNFVGRGRISAHEQGFFGWLVPVACEILARNERMCALRKSGVIRV
jgi:hypothetical protein